jgi:protein tyrosine phosphatase
MFCTLIFFYTRKTFSEFPKRLNEQEEETNNMSQNDIEQIVNKLRKREIEEYFVSKEDFLAFREVIVKEKDFKHFRGIAQHRGAVIYTYMDEQRS